MSKNLRIGIVGPLLGKNPNWVTTQGEILGDLLSNVGYVVKQTSTVPNRLLRLADTAAHIVSWRHEVDLILLMVFSGPAFAMADVSSRLSQLIGIPVIMWLHGGNLPQFSLKRPAWVKRVLARGNRIVSPSPFLAHFYSDWGFDITVIPNVLSLENYNYRHRTNLNPRLFWMRTFADIYNPEMAVEVLHQLTIVFPAATLTMAGQPRGTLNAVKLLTRERGLQNQVRFAGFLDMAGKQREFASHDIFLNTNRVDNMPVSVVEAAAFGLPIVATAVGGIPHLLEHEQTALLVENEDLEGMTNAVKRLLSEPELATRLSTNGRALATSCGWEAVRKKWENVFDQLVN